MKTEDYSDLYNLEDRFRWFVGMRAITAALLDPYSRGKFYERILDSGCGTGGMLSWLIPRGSFGFGKNCSYMKRWKTVFGGILGGFLLFAPPGTMIVLSLVLVGVFGRRWLIAVFVLTAATLAILICAQTIRSQVFYGTVTRDR